MSLSIISGYNVVKNYEIKENVQTLTEEYGVLSNLEDTKEYIVPIEMHNRLIYLLDNNPLPDALENDDLNFVQNWIKHLAFYHKKTELSHLIDQGMLEEAHTLFLSIYDELKSDYLKIKNSNGDTILHDFENEDENELDLLENLLISVPLKNRLSCLQEAIDNEGNTILHTATAHRLDNIMNIALSSLPDDKEKTILARAKNFYGKTLFHWIEDAELLQEILDMIPPNNRLSCISDKDKNGDTPLHIAIIDLENENLIETYLDSLPESAIVKALSVLNNNEQSPLDLIISTFDENFVSLIFQKIPSYQRAKSLILQNSVGLTPLDTAIHHPNFLNLTRILLTLVPQNDRSICINSTNKFGFSIMDKAKMTANEGDHSLLNLLKELVPENDDDTTERPSKKMKLDDDNNIEISIKRVQS